MPYLAEWSDARTAALFLKPCTPQYLNDDIGPLLTRKTGNRPGTRTARSGGWLYHKADLERVRSIMDALGCKAFRAAQLLWQLKELDSRKMLPYLLEQQQLPLDDAAEPRRFQ